MGTNATVRLLARNPSRADGTERHPLPRASLAASGMRSVKMQPGRLPERSRYLSDKLYFRFVLITISTRRFGCCSSTLLSAGTIASEVPLPIV
jgi:hypothetical protein